MTQLGEDNCIISAFHCLGVERSQVVLQSQMEIVS